VIVLAVFGAVVGGDGLALYRRTWISPNEDQGYFISIIQAPEGLR